MTEHAAAPEAPAGVGEALASAREAQGLSLAELARQLKFAPRQLEALEQERFDQLPGGTFARGMVRSYARALKLDPEPLLARLENRFDRPDAGRLAERFKQPVPFSDGSKHSNLIYAALTAVVLVAAGAAAYEWRQEYPAMPRMAFIAAGKAPIEVARDIRLEKETPVKEAAPREERPRAVAVAAPMAEGPNRVAFRCEEESWIEIRDAGGRTLTAQLYPAGSSRSLGGQPPFEVVIGNPRFVQLSYAGKTVDLKPHVRVDVARLTLK